MIAWHAVLIMHQNLDFGAVEMPAQQCRRRAPIGDNHRRVMAGQSGRAVDGKLVPPALPAKWVGVRRQRTQRSGQGDRQNDE